MISDGNSSLRSGDFVRIGDERASPAMNLTKLNPHETASMGIEPRTRRWELSIYPLHQPYSPWKWILQNNTRDVKIITTERLKIKIKDQ